MWTPFSWGHLSHVDTSLLQTPPFYEHWPPFFEHLSHEHLCSMNTCLIGVPPLWVPMEYDISLWALILALLWYGYVTNIDNSLIWHLSNVVASLMWVPLQCEHLFNMGASLIWRVPLLFGGHLSNIDGASLIQASL